MTFLGGFIVTFSGVNLHLGDPKVTLKKLVDVRNIGPKVYLHLLTVQIKYSCVPGSKLPLFPYNRGWSSTKIVGVYLPIRIPFKGGRSPIPNKTRQP